MVLFIEINEIACHYKDDILMEDYMSKKVKNVILAFLLGVFVIIFPVSSGVIAGITNMQTPAVYYLQAGFMLIPIIVFLLFFLVKKKKASDFYFGKIQKKSILFYLLTLPIFIPLSIKGYGLKDVTSFFGILFLYLFVGIAEELYYRAAITKLLDESFSPLGNIIISTLIFGLLHITTALSGADAVETILTIINSLFFGLMAASLLYLTKNVYPLCFIHFLFDFQSKFILMEGNALFICEIIRGTILAFISLGLFIYIIYINKKKKCVCD